MSRLFSLMGAAYLALAPMVVGAQELPRISDMQNNRVTSLNSYKDLLRTKTAELQEVLNAYEYHKLSPVIETARDNYEELKPLMEEVDGLFSDAELDDAVTSLLNFGSGHEDAFGNPQEGFDPEFKYDVQEPDLEETERVLDGLEVVTISCDDHEGYKTKARDIGFGVRDYRGQKDREARKLWSLYEDVERAVMQAQTEFGVSCDGTELDELLDSRASVDYARQEVLKHPLVEEAPKEEILERGSYYSADGGDTWQLQGLPSDFISNLEDRYFPEEGAPKEDTTFAQEGNGYEWAEEGRIPLNVLANPGDCTDDKDLIKILNDSIIGGKVVMCCETGIKLTVDENSGWIWENTWTGGLQVEYPGGQK
jgi:hypothetical protein